MITDKVRVDKWLWAVRVFKTRSLAAEYCEKEKVMINGQPVKASRIVKKNDVISIRKGAFTLQYEVLQIAEKRMSAKLVPDFCKDVTPPDEIERLRMFAIAARSYRMPGDGRPT